ncbi:MAG: amino acid dehydrogenase, partial [Acidimicrobiia bacterium]|nr:amino acid dehydrogenase [Acidimicrobiia bacterium]
MIFDHPEYDDHQQLSFVNDRATGLRAINAIHRDRGTTGGGGVRFRPYRSDADALTDVLRLSKAMTYKMVLAGLPMGGGKTVIIGDPATD